MTQVQQEKVNFRASDGIKLTGTLFRAPSARAIALISGATGVPERFYAKFAEWLAAEQGISCLTFTHRDMDDTSPGAMKASRATMADWGISDAQGARDAARAAYPDLPVWVIGHSLGGMVLAMQPRLDGITRVITIASGLVHHREHPMPYRLLVWYFWFVVGPITTRLLGYLPGKSIGLGSTLPRSVFDQWKRWCTTPMGVLADHTLPPPDWHRNGAPVRIVAIKDDVICPPKLAWRLARVFSGARIEQLEIDPKARGIDGLGHFGLFQSKGQAFWEQIVAPFVEDDVPDPQPTQAVPHLREVGLVRG